MPLLNGLWLTLRSWLSGKNWGIGCIRFHAWLLLPHCIVLSFVTPINSQKNKNQYVVEVDFWLISNRTLTINVTIKADIFDDDYWMKRMLGSFFLIIIDNKRLTADYKGIIRGWKKMLVWLVWFNMEKNLIVNS